MKNFSKAAAIFGGILCAIPGFTASAASVLDIQLANFSGISATQRSVFHQAENFWESRITGYQEGLNVGPLVIDASARAIDGTGNTLAEAGPRGVFKRAASGQRFAVATSGIMSFDTADLFDLEQRGSLFDVVVHEMAHVLGFGTFWTFNNLYVNGSGKYTGARALEVYREEFDPTATFIPVDIVSGPGTRDGHWDENWAGGRSEIMTGFLERGSSPFLSDTSLATFEDMGFTTILSSNVAAVPLPAPVWLAIFGYGAIVLTGRRKKAAI